jgi:hypothetical protein
MVSENGEKPTKAEQATLLLIGSRLSAGEAETLELGLQSDPNNLQSRIRLFGFYNERLAQRELSTLDQVDARLVKHLRWLILMKPVLPTIPDLVMPGYLACSLEQLRSLYEIWLDALDAHEHTFPLLLNAIVFLTVFGCDMELCDRLTLKLEDLDQEGGH